MASVRVWVFPVFVGPRHGLTVSVARSLRRFSALLFAPMGGSVPEIETRSLLNPSEGAAMPVADIMVCQHADPVGMMISRGLIFFARPAVGE